LLNEKVKFKARFFTKVYVFQYAIYKLLCQFASMPIYLIRMKPDKLKWSV